MFLAVILTIIFIIYEAVSISTKKRNRRKDAKDWCMKANYRFNHHRDM